MVDSRSRTLGAILPRPALDIIGGIFLLTDPASTMGSGTKEEGFVTFCLTKILLFEFLNFFFSFWEFFCLDLTMSFLLTE